MRSAEAGQGYLQTIHPLYGCPARICVQETAVTTRLRLLTAVATQPEALGLVIIQNLNISMEPALAQGEMFA